MLAINCANILEQGFESRSKGRRRRIMSDGQVFVVIVRLANIVWLVG